MPETFTHLTCTACGCLCDDLTAVRNSDDTITIDRNCDRAKNWFRTVNSSCPPLDHSKVYQAAEILKSSRSPLIYGLERSSLPAIRLAIELMERLRGTIDTAGDHSATIAYQNFGESTCTLGDIEQRADLIVLLGCDPEKTHPRWFERYAKPKPGRVVLKIDPADISIETLTQLRIERKTGRYSRISQALHDSEWAVFLYDSTPGKNTCNSSVIIELLNRAVIEWNDHPDTVRRRVYTRRLHDHVSGAESVLTWQTGFPFGVSFYDGTPRHCGLDYTASRMLIRHEVDACLLLGVDAIHGLPQLAQDDLQRIPVIAIDTTAKLEAFQHPSAIRIPTVDFAISGNSPATRMDGVRLPLTRLTTADITTDESVLSSLADHVRSN